MHIRTSKPRSQGGQGGSREGRWGEGEYLCLQAREDSCDTASLMQLIALSLFRGGQNGPATPWLSSSALPLFFAPVLYHFPLLFRLVRIRFW